MVSYTLPRVDERDLRTGSNADTFQRDCTRGYEEGKMRKKLRKRGFILGHIERSHAGYQSNVAYLFGSKEDFGLEWRCVCFLTLFLPGMKSPSESGLTFGVGFLAMLNGERMGIVI